MPDAVFLSWWQIRITHDTLICCEIALSGFFLICRLIFSNILFYLSINLFLSHVLCGISQRSLVFASSCSCFFFNTESFQLIFFYKLLNFQRPADKKKRKADETPLIHYPASYPPSAVEPPCVTSCLCPSLQIKQYHGFLFFVSSFVCSYDPPFIYLFLLTFF